MTEIVKKNAAQSASATRPQTSKFSPFRQQPLVYFTEHYNCYDKESTELCRRLADRLVKERHAQPQHLDWLVDSFRDELAAIMSKFVPGGAASARTFAGKRLPYRLNNVWNKYKTMCSHNGGRTVSLNAPLDRDAKETVENSREFVNALLQMDADRRTEEEHRRRLARVADIVEKMPPRLKQLCKWLMEGKSITRTAELFGISRQAFTETWIPKLRRHFIDSGLFAGEDADEQ